MIYISFAATEKNGLIFSKSTSEETRSRKLYRTRSGIMYGFCKGHKIIA